jgi:hypothetical protein
MIDLTPENHRSYFENLAIANKNILHQEETHKQFVCVDIEEVDESVFSVLNLSDWCMVLEDISGRVGGDDSEHLQLIANAAFLIFKHCPEGDRVQERQILDEAFRIGMQIIAKMKKDKYDWNPISNDNLMTNFVPNTLKWEKLKAINDNCFGYRFEFDYSKYSSFKFDASEWNY